MRITSELIANAMAAGTLPALQDPIARALLELTDSVDADIAAASRIPAVGMTLDAFIDLACVHGDQVMQKSMEVQGGGAWHTIALTVLLRSDFDHQLRTVGGAKALERNIADALGLDYGAVRLGRYAIHAMEALSLTPSEFAKTCATMRLEVTGQLPAQVAPSYGPNFHGQLRVHLAQQTILLVAVRSESADDARQMARELNQWALMDPGAMPIEFFTEEGERLEVKCFPMAAGLPWGLRVTSAYDLQGLMASELACTWFPPADFETGRVRYIVQNLAAGCPESGSVTVIAWSGETPEMAHAACFAASLRPQLCEAKIEERLAETGAIEGSAQVVSLDACARTLVLKHGAIPVKWDKRFPLE